MGRLRRTQPPPTWRKPVSQWVDHLKAANLRPETIRTRRYPVVRFALDIGKDPAVVNHHDIEGWLAAKSTLRAETAYAYRAGLRSFYRWAKSEGFVQDDPTSSIAPIRRPVTLPIPAPDDAIRVALHSADKRVRLMIRLGAEHGLRCAEISRVAGADLLYTPFGRALVIYGKGGKERFAYIEDDERELIDALTATNGGPLFPGQIDGHLSPRYVSRLVHGCLPRPWTLHKLRTRFATSAYAAAPDLLTLQQLLGHTSPTTTLRYVAVASHAGRTLTHGARL
jgi:integrase/recombinase XerC